MSPETWLSVPDWPYEVSDQGRVRRAAPAANSHSGRVLRPNIDRYGYPYVRLSQSGVVRDFKVHRLVAQAFHGEPPEGSQTCHRNGDRQDNRPVNLCWGSAADNAADRDKHGTTQAGEKHIRSVFTQQQIDELRTKHAEALEGRQRVPRGWVQQKAAEFGVPRNTLACALRQGYGVQR